MRRYDVQASAADVLALDDMGMTVVTYLNQTTEEVDGRRYWVPREAVGSDGTLLVLRPADDEYSFDGWDVHHARMCGGRRRSLGDAVAWLRRARDVRAGKEKDFIGC